eukprot:GHRQ01021552.1.p2 GENE.GHRQ01021552.1~~GHRQ01021552.1.p2  ORF type:complete len:107 (+),score=9.43 GHRQ01021552.1:400-720(+)
MVPQNGTGSELATPGTAAGSSKVNVQFVVPEYLTHWGQVLKVVGSMDELGNWKVEKVCDSMPLCILLHFRTSPDRETIDQVVFKAARRIPLPWVEKCVVSLKCAMS